MRVCVEKVDVNVREHEVVQDTSTCAFNVDVSLESQPSNNKDCTGLMTIEVKKAA